MSIPKIINYCWFGHGEKPEDVKRYMKTWRKYCPDYKIIEWNEENFDINLNNYVKEAYDAKKYAFVTDYVRLFALYKYGGVYLDTDVEIIRPIDNFLKDKAFFGFENNDLISTGIIGAEKNNELIKDLMNEYKNLHFIKEDGEYDLTANTARITTLSVKKYGLIPKSSYQELKNGVATIYPYDYFSPKNWRTGIINITKNTYMIHHFSGSWLSKEKKERLEYKNKIISKYIKKYGEKKGKRIGEIIYKSSYALTHPIKTLKHINNKEY